MYHSVAFSSTDPVPDIFIMSPDRYMGLSSVYGFCNLNGKTYQEHIIKTAGERIPKNIHILIMATKNPEDALEILCNNQIPYVHEDGVIQDGTIEPIDPRRANT